MDLDDHPHGIVVVGGRYEHVELRDASTLESVSFLAPGGGRSFVDLVTLNDSTFAIGVEWGNDQQPQIIDIVDVNARETTLRLAGHSGLVRRMTSLDPAFSLEHPALLSSSNDSTVRLWNCETGREILCIAVGKGSGCVTDLISNRLIVAGLLSSGESVVGYDLETGSFVWSVSPVPQGNTSTIGTWMLDRTRPHDPSGELLFCPGSEYLSVIDPRSLSIVASMSLSGQCKTVRVVPDRNVVIASPNGVSLNIWDLRRWDGNLLNQFTIHGGNVNGFWQQIRRVTFNDFVSVTQHGSDRVVRFDLKGNVLSSKEIDLECRERRSEGLGEALGREDVSFGDVHCGLCFMGERPWDWNWLEESREMFLNDFDEVTSFILEQFGDWEGVCWIRFDGSSKFRVWKSQLLYPS